jgi:hypothetical protein
LGGQTSIGGIAPENALDALLDELQTFAKPPNHNDQLQVDLVLLLASHDLIIVRFLTDF